MRRARRHDCTGDARVSLRRPQDNRLYLAELLRVGTAHDSHYRTRFVQLLSLYRGVGDLCRSRMGYPTRGVSVHVAVCARTGAARGLECAAIYHDEYDHDDGMDPHFHAGYASRDSRASRPLRPYA